MNFEHDLIICVDIGRVDPKHHGWALVQDFSACTNFAKPCREASKTILSTYYGDTKQAHAFELKTYLWMRSAHVTREVVKKIVSIRDLPAGPKADEA